MSAVQFSESLLDRLVSARRVVALTGAGISAESGVPTFRDPGGLWAQFRPEELASVDAFLANPTLVQSWYRHRREVVTRVQPNPGHFALVEMAGLVPEFTLVTQNVDDLHRRAGSGDVIELHGNLTRSYCTACGRPANPVTEPAVCAECGRLVRPDVVWFGEALPEEALTAAWEAAERADVFLTIGTSAVVYPAAELPLIAVSAGALVVEINVERSAIADRVHEVLLGPSGRILPALAEAVRERLTDAPHSGLLTRTSLS